MAHDVVDFYWSVPEAGFKFESLAALRFDSTLGPVERLMIPAGGDRSRTYRPLFDEPAMFRRFAEIGPSEADVLGFANAFGRLAGKATVRINRPSPDDPSRSIHVGAEPLSRWLEQVNAMRRAVMVWDLCQADDTGGLSRVIAWREGEGDQRWSVHFEGNGELTGASASPPSGLTSYSYCIASADEIWSGYRRFDVGELVRPAMSFVQQVINEGLKYAAHPSLMWDQAQFRLGLHLVPDGLLPALWLQFAQAVAGNKVFRRCQECGAWFEVSLKAYRTSRVFCSNSCRTKAYRERQERARRLKAEGMTVAKIAAELGSDVETVKGWVKAKKE